MKNKNICKFITEPNLDKIEVHCFVYESDISTMKTPHILSRHRVILIKNGNGKIKIDGKESAFDIGCLIFVFSGECLEVHPEHDCEYMYIDFSGARSEKLLSRFFINEHNRLHSNFDGLIPLWHDSLCRASGANLDLVAESIILYTFSRFAADYDKKNDLIGKVLEMTEEYFTNPDLSVSAIAEELSYNAKYISHIFKEKMGVSYSEYLRNVRIKYAVSLLEHGIDSVKNIAFLSGFSDPLYFSNVFKKTIGVSPKEYKTRTPKPNATAE